MEAPTIPSPTTPLTNGGLPGGEVAKPKPPTKPSKLTRAFSSGSITLPSFGKSKAARRKSKNVEAQITNLKETEQESDPLAGKANGVKENGVKENGKEPSWKLPGIGTMPKLQARGSLMKYSVSDSLLTDRDLPPLPLPLPQPDHREMLEARGLSPIPDSDPQLPVRAGENPPVVLSSSPKDFPEVRTLNVNGSPSLLKKNGYEEIEIKAGNVSPFSNTPPTSFDSNSSRKQFRPLPPTPPLSDEDDDFVPNADSFQASDLPEAHGDSALVEDVNANGTETFAEDENLTYQEIAVDVALETSDAKEVASSSSKEPSVSSSTALPTTQEADETQSYTVCDIINTYSYALPVRVRILQGYCSDTTEVNISTDDIYNIHSVQQTKKVMVKDEDGMTHCIPIDAHVKVGLVYNPNNDYDTSLNGYIFKTVSEVSLLPVLPKLISATQSVNSGDEKSGVTAGEIFIVKSVHRSMFKGKKGLKVYSLATKSNKVLFDDCQGVFSTKPSLVRMDLPELLENVRDVFPSCAVIYPTTDASDFPGIYIVYCKGTTDLCILCTCLQIWWESYGLLTAFMLHCNYVCF